MRANAKPASAELQKSFWEEVLACWSENYLDGLNDDHAFDYAAWRRWWE